MKVEYKYFIILMTMASIVSILVLHNAHKENNNYTLDTNKINNQYINVNDFGIYLQNKDNKSQYVKQESNDYPTSGYVLNVDKTTCYDYHGKEVTGKVSQTDEGRVRLETTVSIYCQMYFDIDDEAPTIDSFTISGTDISGNSMVDYTYGTTIKYTVTWSAEDVVSYCITDSDSCNKYIKTNGETSIDGELNLSDTIDGIKTITVHLKDIAQNESTKQATITLDTTAPAINNLTLKGKGANTEQLQNGYTYDYNISYTADWGNDDVVSICASTNQTCTEYKTTSNLKNYTGSITLSQGEESKTVYVWIKDRVGNASVVKQETITVDRTKPTISKFTITGRDTSYALNPNVTYKIELSDNSIDKYCITTNNSSANCDWKSGSNNSITATEPKLSTGDGKKIMYAFIKDKAGNVSNSSSNSIILDENAPTATIDYVSSTSTRVTVRVSGNDGTGSGIDTSKMYCRVKGGEIQQAKTDGTCTVSGLNELQSYEIEAYVYDLVGKQSAVISNSYDTTMSPGTYVKSKNPAGLNTTKELGELYRYVGGCDAKDGGCDNIVDNFICFGTETPAEDCSGNVTSEYMYRIIGIDPLTEDLKLIKNVALMENGVNSFTWTDLSAPSQTWNTSRLMLRISGDYPGTTPGADGDTQIFVNSQTSNVRYLSSGNHWVSLMKNRDWIFGDISAQLKSPVYVPWLFDIETGKTSTTSSYYGARFTWEGTVKSLAGLLYMHDFWFSFDVSHNGLDSSTTNCSYYSGCSGSWLHISKNGKGEDNQTEWLLDRYGASAYGGYQSWTISPDGSSVAALTTEKYSVRPVFYLDASRAVISGGKGTLAEPFIVS